MTFGVIEGGSAGWSSPATLVPLLVAVVALMLFLVHERRAADPMLPLSLFASRTFSGASFVGLAINLGFYGQLFALSLLFQHAWGYSPLVTGLAMLPEGLFVAISSALSGRVTARLGPRVPMLAGLLIGTAGFLGLLGAESSTAYAVLIAPLVAAGFGMAFTMPAATAAAIEAAPADRAGIASGVLGAARQAGSALGVALLGTLTAGRLVPGFHAAMFVSAGAFLAGAIVTLVAVERVPDPVAA